MGKNFWAVVAGVISKADILLEIIDARVVDQTRNVEIEERVKNSGKPLIYVLNKCDLADKDKLDEIKKTLIPSVFISCKTYHGINLLKERIRVEGKKKGFEKPRVGVLGYPNMGKSSVINALTGTGTAGVSSMSGFTRGKHYINMRQFFLIDTPGVIPYGEKDHVKNMMTGITTRSKDPELDLLLIMDEHPGIIESHYAVPVEKDTEKTLEKIAIKLHCVRKGNLPNIARASELILKQLREGKIKI